MHLNADFTCRIALHTTAQDWVTSPMPGVERRMLDRIGDEVARATSLVRYAPGSRFSPHVHGGGEELFVLDGVFEDEHGSYPTGSYVRNPPGSRHAPSALSGCTIFVKLWQFIPQDRRRVVLLPDDIATRPRAGAHGIAVATLFEATSEKVRLEVWQAGTQVDHLTSGGLEILCINGSFTESGETFRRWSWLRLPHAALLSARAGPEGCQVWIKTGHLGEGKRVR